MDKIKPLFTATATAIGGRNGHTETSDAIVSADLSVPKEMGGSGKPETATPEHLFAAGYAACFGGAVDYVAKQQKKDASKATITCAVSIGPREGGGFGLSVKMRVRTQRAAMLRSVSTSSVARVSRSESTEDVTAIQTVAQRRFVSVGVGPFELPVLWLRRAWANFG